MEYLVKEMWAAKATYFADTGYLARPWLVRFGDNLVLAILLVLLWVNSKTHTISLIFILIWNYVKRFPELEKILIIAASWLNELLC